MRILSAMAAVACELGVESATVSRVVARAGVSRRTFYDLFEDRGECFLAVFDETLAQAGERVATLKNTEHGWLDRIRSGLFAILVFFDEEPELARACIVQALGGGPLVLERRAEVIADIVRAIDGVRAELGEKQPLPLTAESVLGGVLAIVHGRLLAPDPGRLVDLHASLMGLIVLPYLGAAAARRELTRALPAIPPTNVDNEYPHAPLDGLEMRVTYRTLRVLQVIAEYPEVSNREVAQNAGIRDQGQVSRLLTRLQDLGLIYNTGEGHAKGTTNAWHLTTRGAEVQQAVRPHP